MHDEDRYLYLPFIPCTMYKITSESNAFSFLAIGKHTFDAKVSVCVDLWDALNDFIQMLFLEKTERNKLRTKNKIMKERRKNRYLLLYYIVVFKVQGYLWYIYNVNLFIMWHCSYMKVPMKSCSKRWNTTAKSNENLSLTQISM